MDHRETKALYRSSGLWTSSEARVHVLGCSTKVISEMRAVGIRSVRDITGNRSVCDQTIAVQRHPLTSVLAGMINKPSEFACAVRNRNKRNRAVTRSRLILPLF